MSFVTDISTKLQHPPKSIEIDNNFMSIKKLFTFCQHFDEKLENWVYFFNELN